MASTALTEGAMAILSSGNADLTEFKPVLKVADLRLVGSQPNMIERYLISLSDGKSVQQGILAPHQNGLIKSEKLRKGSLVELTQFFCKFIQNRMIIIILDLDVLAETCDRIGLPKQYPVKTEAGADTPKFSPTSIEDAIYDLKI